MAFFGSTPIDSPALDSALLNRTPAQLRGLNLTPLPDTGGGIVVGRNPGSLPRWRAAVAKLYASGYRPKLLFVGDSKDMGAGSGTASGTIGVTVGAAQRNKTAWLAQMLAGRIPVMRQNWFGNNGLATLSDAQSYDARRTISSDWAVNSFASLGGNMFVIASGKTGALTFAPDVAVDRFDVIGLQGGSAGQLVVTDGSTSTTMDFNNSTLALVRKTASFTRGAGKTISLTIAGSSTNSVYVGAGIAYDSQTPAIELANAGWYGSSTTNWAPASNPWDPTNAIAAYAPDLTVIQLGTNDMGNSVALATYTANLQALINTAKQSGDVIVEIPTQPQSTNPGFAVYATYTAAAKQVAISSGCMIVDHGARFGTWAVANGYGLMSDGLHETAAGYADEARALSDVLVF